MLARLLESKKDGERPGWGALVSTIAHTVAIGAAVFATAQARVDERATAEVVRWVTPPIARPVTAPAPRIPPRRSRERPALAATPAPLVIDRIDVAPTSGVASTEPFAADQVERQVYLRPGSPPPRYPNGLREAGIEGQVVALFVVNEAGRVELPTVRFARSDNSLFEAAVRDALASMRFGAAEVGGKKVRQLVQMPFVFTLSR